MTTTSETHEEPTGAPAKPGLSTTTFEALGLGPEILRAVHEMGFTAPMDVQAKTFPIVRDGRDLMVQSRTGSGKTAAFGIPIADRVVDPAGKFVQAIILLPTRELALQVAAELARIVPYRGIAVVPVYGGAPMGRQIEQIQAGGQIICGTPGRVLDHIRRGTLKLDRVKVAVLDECDEMLSMGFQEDIEAILERTPAERQTLLFSATVPEGIQRLSKRFMRNPEHLKLSADFVGVHEIGHIYYTVPGTHREGDLLRILEFENPGRAIIFCNTREETGRVAEFLRGKGHDAEAISSDLSQADRERVMTRMRAGGIRFLVATDVAARGIDLENLSHVFNFTFPDSPEVYIHRTGRTGRAGRHGTAVSLIGPTEVGPFYYLKLLYKIRPEERALPSEIEIQSRREGEKIEALRAAFQGEPGKAWRSLARRLLGTPDVERMVAALLDERFSRVERRPSESHHAGDTGRDGGVRHEPRASTRTTSHEPREPRSERPAHIERPPQRDARVDEPRESGRVPREGARETRENGREAREGGSESRVSVRDPRESTREPRESTREPRESTREPRESTREPREGGHEPRDHRSARDPRSGRDQSVRRERAPHPERPRDPAAPRGESEFWDVWGDETPKPAAAPAPVDAPPSVRASAATRPSSGTSPDAELGADVVRLYLNVGRKDRATAEDVANLVASAQGPEPLSIEVMNTHTYLNVPSASAAQLAAALSTRELNGRQLSCEVARPRRR